LKDRIHDRFPETQEELEQVTMEEWNRLGEDRDYFQHLFQSMDERCCRIIAANGERIHC